MLLIDALNVASFGGRQLLYYLIKRLDRSGVPYRLLVSERSDPSMQEALGEIVHVKYTSLFFQRGKILRQHMKEINPNTLLCFGNFPPPIRVPKSVSVVVSFQNIFLASADYDGLVDFKKRWALKIKRRYLRWFFNNADFWVFPTEYIKELFKKHYSESKSDYRVIPFYDKDRILRYSKRISEKTKGEFIYVSSPASYKNHKRLCEAWKSLDLDNGARLVLVVKASAPEWVRISDELEIEKLSSIEVIDTGDGLPYDQVLERQAQSEFTIYPSLAETFGYGTIEGGLLGNTLLVHDAPFFSEVVKQSVAFDGRSVTSIATAIHHVLSEEKYVRSEVFFEDRVEELIALIT